MVARNKMVLTGWLGSPRVEEWQVGIHFAADDGIPVVSLAALQGWATTAASILTLGAADYAGLTGALSTSAGLERVDIYGYGPTGPAVASAGADFSWNGTGTPSKPFSTCSVWTLRTDFSGPSRRGRVYWPSLGGSISANGKQGISGAYADDVAELLNDMAGASAIPGMQPVVYSAALDVVTPVTSVRIGDVPDHQRRRTMSIPETFVARAV